MTMDFLLNNWQLMPPIDSGAKHYDLVKTTDIGRQLLYNRTKHLLDKDVTLYTMRSVDYDDSPFRMKHAKELAQKVWEWKRTNEKILIYGDSDADGINSTALITLFLRNIGLEVETYLPNRLIEAYGLRADALIEYAQRGFKVVITVDNGIRAHDEIDQAKKMGFYVAVTDHHSVGETLPNADLIINPKQDDCDYPEDMLSGTGVAYKVCQAVALLAPISKRYELIQYLHTLTPFVAIGTCADMMPMDRAENRALVWDGLLKMAETQFIGILALLTACSINKSFVTTSDIGFSIAPRINAAGRLKDPNIALDLLLCNDADEAKRIAKQLTSLNDERKEITKKYKTSIINELGEGNDDNILVYVGDFPRGIAGLIAGQLKDHYNKPAIAMSVENGIMHGSARSIKSFDITNALQTTKDLLINFGGHASAAGLSLSVDKFDEFSKQLGLLQVPKEKNISTVDLELDLELAYANLSSEVLDLCEPYGNCNSSPLFMARNVVPINWRLIGSDLNTLKIEFANPSGYKSIEMFGFGMGGLYKHIDGRPIDIIYRAEYQRYATGQSLKFYLVDLRVQGEEQNV